MVLTAPESAMAMKHHSATAENLRAARSAWSPDRMACANSANSPPAHSAPGYQGEFSRPLVARVVGSASRGMPGQAQRNQSEH